MMAVGVFTFLGTTIFLITGGISLVSAIKNLDVYDGIFSAILLTLAYAIAVKGGAIPI
ncbi:MAG: hypothetical protein ABEK59_01245 [Halobacteria archaeon]